MNDHAIFAEAAACCDEPYVCEGDPRWPAPPRRDGRSSYLFVCRHCGNWLVECEQMWGLVTAAGIIHVSRRLPHVYQQLVARQRLVRTMRTTITLGPHVAAAFRFRGGEPDLADPGAVRFPRRDSGSPPTCGVERRELRVESQKLRLSARVSQLSTLRQHLWQQIRRITRLFLRLFLRLTTLMTGARLAPRPRTTDARANRAGRAAG